MKTGQICQGFRDIAVYVRIINYIKLKGIPLDIYMCFILAILNLVI